MLGSSPGLTHDYDVFDSPEGEGALAATGMSTKKVFSKFTSDDMEQPRLRRRTWLKATAAVAAAPAFVSAIRPVSAGEATPEPLPLGDRRELFVDDLVIGSLEGLRRVWHQPTPQEIAIEHDSPWEGTGSGYHSVIEDGGRYRMYYRGGELVLDGKNARFDHGVVCMAESDDGIVWRKPAIGLVAFAGSKANNIILNDGSLPGAPIPIDPTHIGGVIVDDRPGVDPDERYKAFLGVSGERSLMLIGSADGVRFRLLSPQPVLAGGQFDSQNVIMYDSVAGLYRGYCRGWSGDGLPGSVRGIRTATSPDARRWSGFQPLEYTDPTLLAATHLYTNAVKPYARAPHLLIGLPVRYVEQVWDDSLRALPEVDERRRRSDATERYGTAITETLFMSSRDGVRFTVHDEAFLRPGLERDGTWLYGQNYPAYQLVETRSSLDPGINELSLYAVERYWHGRGSVLRRHTLRLDGFASLHAGRAGGELVTPPLVFSGNRLTLNLSTAAAGTVRVAIEQPDGGPIAGFSTDDAVPLYGDGHAKVVSWKAGPDCGRLAGRPVRIRFRLKEADLYAIQFVGT